MQKGARGASGVCVLYLVRGIVPARDRMRRARSPANGPALQGRRRIEWMSG